MNLFLRADGGRSVGFGHLARCHALAQAARRRGFSPCFLPRPGDGTGVAKLRALGERVVPLSGSEDGEADLAATLGAMREAVGERGLRSAILVTDHNGLGEGWIRGAREAGPVVVSLNDLPKIRYASHLVVNGNVGAEGIRYETEPDTHLLLGPEYTLFRDEFLVPGVRHETHPPLARRLLVSLGAGDPGNMTQAVLEATADIKSPLEVTLVVGGAYTHLASLKRAARSSPHETHIAHDLGETASVFAAAEIAVCAGGSTAYEMAFLGVPAVVLVLSETQQDAAEALDATGAAVCLGAPEAGRIVDAVESLRPDRARREALATRGATLFDGRGRARVLDAAEALLGPAGREDRT
jgi:UDP-2,4-diacetamido-2,4,6-trideoxy-beta-L-altropyranose hydrolase